MVEINTDVNIQHGKTLLVYGYFDFFCRMVVTMQYLVYNNAIIVVNFIRLLSLPPKKKINSNEYNYKLCDYLIIN